MKKLSCINSIKNIGKKISIGALASLLFLGGCAYNWKGDTSWKFLRTINTEERIIYTETEKIDEKVREKRRKYNIGEIGLTGNSLNINVAETKIGGLSYGYKKTDIIDNIWEIEYYRKDAEKMNEAAEGQYPFFKKTDDKLIGLGFVASVLGLASTVSEERKDQRNFFAALTLALYTATRVSDSEAKERAAKFLEETDRTYDTCDFKTEKSTKKGEKSETYWESTDDEKIISKNLPAKNIPVKIASDYFRFTNNSGETTSSTNEDGTASAKIYTREDDAFTKQKLMDRIESEYSKYVKKGKEEFFDKISEGVFARKETVEIVTKKEKIKDIEIVNNLKNAIISFYSFDENAVDRAVKAVVDKRINPNIKEVKFTLRDTESHYPINGARIEIKSDAPGAEELASACFSGPLLKKAVRYVLPYEIKNEKDERGNILSFFVYMPATYSFEITHPSYNYLSSQNMKFDEKNLDKIVNMVELGSKERKEDAEKMKGQIINKE